MTDFVRILWTDGRTYVLTFLTLTQVEPENYEIDATGIYGGSLNMLFVSVKL